MRPSEILDENFDVASLQNEQAPVLVISNRTEIISPGLKRMPC